MQLYILFSKGAIVAEFGTLLTSVSLRLQLRGNAKLCAMH